MAGQAVNDPEIIAVRVAGVFVVDGAGRVLMQHRDDKTPIFPNQWQMIGGVIEEGEAPEHAACREVKEESGIDLQGAVTFLRRVITPRPPPFPGAAEWFLFCAWTRVPQAEISCGEGRAIVFKTADEIAGLDLTPRPAEFLQEFLRSPAYRDACCGRPAGPGVPS